MTYQEMFQNLWVDYLDQNSDIKKVNDLFINDGENVVNDHIAFRTIDNDKISIDVLAQAFLNAGYKQAGTYTFVEKKLIAKHFEHQIDKDAPKVFISAIQTKYFSESVQQIFHDLIEDIPCDIGSDVSFLWSGRPWSEIKYEVYLKLKEESEYAAWLYVNGFRANHFTVSINSLKKHTDIYELNNYLRANGFNILEVGGEVKGSAEELLEQSSTIAGKICVNFEEGEKEIPSCFYEFAKRYKNGNGELFSGFIAKSADKIFESTDNK